MRFYRVHLRTEGGVSAGFEWFWFQRQAVAAKLAHDATVEDEADKCDEPEAVEIALTKDGVLRALNRYASHPDNG